MKFCEAKSIIIIEIEVGSGYTRPRTVPGPNMVDWTVFYVFFSIKSSHSVWRKRKLPFLDH